MSLVAFCTDVSWGRPVSVSSYRVIFFWILITSYLATFLGTNSLYVLMCRKAVNHSTFLKSRRWPYEMTLHFFIDDKHWGPALWSEQWTRVAHLKLICCCIGSQWSEFRAEVVLVVERVTTQAKEATRWRQLILREDMLVWMELT